MPSMQRCLLHFKIPILRFHIHTKCSVSSRGFLLAILRHERLGCSKQAEQVQTSRGCTILLLVAAVIGILK